MATKTAGITRRTNTDGSTSWAARCKDLNRKDLYRTFPTRAEAVAWRASIEAAKHQGVNPSPQAGKMLFEAWAQQWMASQRLSCAEGTVTINQGQLDRHLLPAFGARRLGSITPTDVQTFIHDMVAHPYKPSTVRQSYKSLHALFTAAVIAKTVGESPCVGIALPKLPPKRKEAMPDAVVRGIIAAIEPRYSAMVLLAAQTGMRQGELLGLRWAHVNEDGPSITVDAQFTQQSVKEGRLVALKTAKSHRTVPVAREVIDALHRHRLTFGMGSIDGVNDLVFPSRTGGPVEHGAFAHHWKPMQDQFNLAKGEGMHQFRHYAGSRMIREGLSLVQVRDYLGHSSLEELDTYCHQFADDTGDALRNAMAGMFAA